MENGKTTLSGVLSPAERIKIDLVSLVSTLFLTFYAQVICPFLESLPFLEQLRNLIIVFVFQTAVRETMFRLTGIQWGDYSVPRLLYRVLIVSWLASGVAAMGLHEILYNNYIPGSVYQSLPWPSDVPWHSQLKLMSGYWFLGAGLLSQLELTMGERYIRNYAYRVGFQQKSFNEHISRRITIGNFFYTFVPSVSLLIIIIRYAFQDRIIPPAITVEVAYIGVVFIAASIVASGLYGRMLMEDTRRIVDAIDLIGKGDFTAHVWPSRQDELGRISEGINQMAQGLILRERIRESFGRFVSPEIAEKFVEQYTVGKDMRGHGEKKMVAVLMCDIRGFSAISETMDPSDITSMLNHYFDHMVGAIQNFGGFVDKFIGDAVMAVFGLAGDVENPCVDALNAAVEMRRALRDFNQENAERGFPRLENGIGIHYGEVTASYLGSSDRLEFTVIGSTVNTAARLESLARKPNPPIVFSREAAQAVSSDFGIVSIGEHDLKGIGKQKLYSVRSRTKRTATDAPAGGSQPVQPLIKGSST